MNKLKTYIKALRLPFITASIIPVLLGTVISYHFTTQINWLYFTLTLLAMIFLHLGANLANDYFDHLTGADEANKEFIHPFTGGSRVIQEKLLSEKTILCSSILFYSLATIIGVYLIIKVGYLILLLGLFGAISGFFYVSPKLSWMTLGIAELLIGFNFGLLPTLGSFYVQTNTIHLTPLIASISVSLLITAVLFINEFPDYQGDKKVEKKTIVVRLGRKKASIVLISILICSFLSIIIPVIVEILPAWSLLTLLTIPLFMIAFQFIYQFYNNPQKIAPANISIILSHLIVGLFMILSFSKNIISSSVFFITIILLTLFTLMNFLKIAQLKKKILFS